MATRRTNAKKLGQPKVKDLVAPYLTPASREAVKRAAELIEGLTPMVTEEEKHESGMAAFRGTGRKATPFRREGKKFQNYMRWNEYMAVDPTEVSKKLLIPYKRSKDRKKLELVSPLLGYKQKFRQDLNRFLNSTKAVSLQKFKPQKFEDDYPNFIFLPYLDRYNYKSLLRKIPAPKGETRYFLVDMPIGKDLYDGVLDEEITVVVGAETNPKRKRLIRRRR